jgi:hypothetical protein
MSAPTRNDTDKDASRRYVPPWVRNAANDAGDVPPAPTEKLGREPAPPLTEPEVRRRRHEPVPFDGDSATRGLRAQASLDPVAVPQPPRARPRNSAIPMLLRVAGGVALAAFAVVFMKGLAPESMKLADDGTRPIQLGTSGPVAAAPAAAMPPAQVAMPPAQVAMPPAQVAMQPAQVAPAPAPAPAQVAAAPAVSRPPAPVPAVSPPPAPTVSPAPPLRTMDREEAAALYSRGEQLIAVGDIVGARLLFSRAAEGGDARSAFAMGASYDPNALKALGVVGVIADRALAREWYGKASSLGSRDAAQRIEALVRLR